MLSVTSSYLGPLKVTVAILSKTKASKTGFLFHHYWVLAALRARALAASVY
jgi:hypothetical protein